MGQWKRCGERESRRNVESEEEERRRREIGERYIGEKGEQMYGDLQGGGR